MPDNLYLNCIAKIKGMPKKNDLVYLWEPYNLLLLLKDQKWLVENYTDQTFLLYISLKYLYKVKLIFFLYEDVHKLLLHGCATAYLTCHYLKLLNS